MYIYLPIAEISVDFLIILGMGAFVGFLAGMFGVGGGFLMTPLLMFLGVPPPVAVGSQVAQVVASSVSGVMAHTRKNNVDFRLGFVLLIGGAVGSSLGAYLFRWLERIGQLDLAISLMYVVFLGLVGGLMLIESIQSSFLRRHKGNAEPERADGTRKRRRRQAIGQNWPFQVFFPQSGLKVSLLLPISLGFAVGILSAIMGVGGGFIMVPAMIYLLGVPTRLVIGTSLLQIAFVAAFLTLVHSVSTQTVDLFLALILIFGSVIGAQLGTRVGLRMQSEQLRGLLAALVLAVSLTLLFDLLKVPADLYSITPITEFRP